MCHNNIFIFGPIPDGGVSRVDGARAPVYNAVMGAEKDIALYSMCEHHLLPLFGHAHVAYVPDERVVGLSKLARTVDAYAKRPQIQ